jgi:hypothetical protein
VLCLLVRTVDHVSFRLDFCWLPFALYPMLLYLFSFHNNSCMLLLLP